jgi:hypothetical protein
MNDGFTFPDRVAATLAASTWQFGFKERRGQSHHGGGDRDNAPSKGELKSAKSDAAGGVSGWPPSIAGRVTESHV